MPTQEVACATNPAALLCEGRRGPHVALLDGGGPESWGLGQALFMEDPRATLEVFATGWGRWRRGGAVRWKWGSPLQQWSEFLAAASSLAPDLPEPDAAGILTILSYELKHWIERLPRRHVFPVEPVLFSAFYDWSGMVDYRAGRAWLRAQTSSDLHARVRGWSGADGAGTPTAKSEPVAFQVCPSMSESAYCKMVETALEYIAAGDIYQVNLAQRFRAPLKTEDGAALFEVLRASYPMPFGAYVDGGDWVVVSNSPECFLLADGPSVATFPIKGTRRTAPPLEPVESISADGAERANTPLNLLLPRRLSESAWTEAQAMTSPFGKGGLRGISPNDPHQDPPWPPFSKKGERGCSENRQPPTGEERGVVSSEESDRAARDLANDPKERAEHVMIVDLERNDLGRVCEPGSVAVREFAALRFFPFLHHMVSRVEGHLAPGTSLADLMRAMFPGGSVTGAPKIRAMEIIEELEPCSRGFYTGAIGWTDLHGRSRFNLAIRTAVISAQGLSYHAGGGIVADSDPRREYEETLLKSEAFFRALAELR